MHPRHKKDLIISLEKLKENIDAEISKLNNRRPERLMWSVESHISEGWQIALDDRVLSTDEVEKLVVGGIWALFEMIRKGPDDPEAFQKVIQTIIEKAQDQCHQKK